jgi:NAD(P)-dependent dehydrogenase (short-subunit alcohol dehydrogenase family)
MSISRYASTLQQAFATDAGDASQVNQLFEDVARVVGEPDVVVYNASGRLRGALIELDPSEVQHAVHISAFGDFLNRQIALTACSIRMP